MLVSSGFLYLSPKLPDKQSYTNIRLENPLRIFSRDGKLLAEFGIAHLRRAPALALSGGERRRCEIARALATHPSYILLDEPLAGIDPIAVGEIRDLVKHLKDRGIGVLITDHNVRETLGSCDRAYILAGGEIIAQGLPGEVASSQTVLETYLGENFKL